MLQLKNNYHEIENSKVYGLITNAFYVFFSLRITMRLNDWINEYLLVMGNIDIYIIVYWSKKGSL